MSEFSSRRPYLIRALYEWILDNDCTPHLLVATDVPGVDVPQQFVTEEGRITINISANAVRGLELGNQWILFSARFGGRSHAVSIPPGAVLALYARENGEGMLFGEVELPAPDDSHEEQAEDEHGASAADSSQPGRSHLRVIK